MAAATDNAVVAFEADEVDAHSRTGWSFTAVGRAEMVTDPDDLAALARLPLRPWAPGGRTTFLRIKIELLNGRRIVDRFTTRVDPARGGVPS